MAICYCLFWKVHEGTNVGRFGIFHRHPGKSSYSMSNGGTDVACVVVYKCRAWKATNVAHAALFHPGLLEYQNTNGGPMAVSN